MWQILTACAGDLARLNNPGEPLGDDPEVEPGQTAMQVFFDWPRRSASSRADPTTIHRFVTANAAAVRGYAAVAPLP